MAEKPLKVWQRNAGRIALKPGEIISYGRDDGSIIVADTTNKEFLKAQEKKAFLKIERQKASAEKVKERYINKGKRIAEETLKGERKQLKTQIREIKNLGKIEEQKKKLQEKINKLQEKVK